jgi:dihydrofolate reductase
MRVRYYLAVSLDGALATRDGGVGWLDEFSSEEAGTAEFMNEIEGLVVGRATLDVSLKLGPWYFGERPTVVLTHRPLPPEAPAVCEALAGTPAEALAALAARGVRGDVWLLGGGQVAAAFLEAGLLDTVEVAIAPVLLGGGIPMVGSLPAWQGLELASCRTLPNGMILASYRVRR